MGEQPHTGDSGEALIDFFSLVGNSPFMFTRSGQFIQTYSNYEAHGIPQSWLRQCPSHHCQCHLGCFFFLQRGRRQATVNFGQGSIPWYLDYTVSLSYIMNFMRSYIVFNVLLSWVHTFTNVIMTCGREKLLSELKNVFLLFAWRESVLLIKSADSPQINKEIHRPYQMSASINREEKKKKEWLWLCSCWGSSTREYSPVSAMAVAYCILNEHLRQPNKTHSTILKNENKPNSARQRHRNLETEKKNQSWASNVMQWHGYSTRLKISSYNTITRVAHCFDSSQLCTIHQ